MEFDLLLDKIENSKSPAVELFRGIDESLNQRATGTKLVDLHDVDLDEWVKDETHIYIGRAHGNVEESYWANEYKVEEHGRDRALQMFRDKVISSPQMMAKLSGLTGLSLGCWCPWPLKCHGQALIDLLCSQK